jgi:hypothetical protein
MWYDRDGIPITAEEWERLFPDLRYRIIARTTVTDAADPTKAFDVSTVWLGIDYSFGYGPPRMFETMVFGDGADEFDILRHTSEEQARREHTEMVIVVAAEMTDPVTMDAVEAWLELMEKQGKSTGG